MKRFRRQKTRCLLLWLTVAAACVFLGVGFYNVYKPLPAGLSSGGPERPAEDITFLRDLTWVDAGGVRHVEQEIFDRILEMIGGARKLVLLDMFLFNDFGGREEQAPYRRLAHEVTEVLVARKKQYPQMRVVVITDPINTVYGGLENPYLERLAAAGIEVVFTRLGPLRDSNPAYSALWRILARPFGSSSGGLLPNPFGKGNVPLRSYLAMLNFKANHRKIVICDADNSYAALVTSANPHDGSSAHGNVALYFTGPAVYDLLETEQAVLAFSGAPSPPMLPEEALEPGGSDITVQVLTEEKIKETLLQALDRSGAGDRLRMIAFYLSDRDVIRALRKASGRGAEVRVLLDPNKDAFGRRKNGIPNRQVAAELVRESIPVRWGDTHGEQLHTKMVLAAYRDGTSMLILGSANFTRRNLEDLNLETDVAVRGPGALPLFAEVRDYIDLLWNNTEGRLFSADYSRYADNALHRRLLYRWMEATGMSTF